MKNRGSALSYLLIMGCVFTFLETTSYAQDESLSVDETETGEEMDFTISWVCKRRATDYRECVACCSAVIGELYPNLYADDLLKDCAYDCMTRFINPNIFFNN